jgi:hypothetical protein
MYQLNYNPEKLNNYNDYFIGYIETKDDKYFSEFLHYYEPILNGIANKYIVRNSLEKHRLQDLKQIFVSLLWSELQSYTTDNLIPLLQIIKLKLPKVWDEYLRTSCNSISVESENGYRNYRAVIKLFCNQPKEMSVEVKIKTVSKELTISESTVKKYLELKDILKNTNTVSLDDNTKFGTLHEELIVYPETMSSEDIFFKNLKLEQLKNTIDELSPKDKKLLELTTGICLNCFGFKEKKTYRETSLLLGMTESAVEKRRKKILEELSNSLKRERLT